jgi:hypothetical protein
MGALEKSEIYPLLSPNGFKQDIKRKLHASVVGLKPNIKSRCLYTI